MGYRHIVVVQNVVDDQVIYVAFVAGDQDERPLQRHLLHVIENRMIDGNAVEHGPGNPPHNGRRKLDKGRFIVGGDFLYVPIGLAANLVDWNITAFGIRTHKLLQAIIGQNTFFQLLFGFANRSGDALTVAIELNQQIPSQHQRLIFR